MRNQSLVCALLIGSLLLNACASALPLSVGVQAVSGRIASTVSDLSVLPAPWLTDEHSHAETSWQLFEETVRADLLQHPATDQITVSLLSRAHIPGQTASAVAVELGNAGPYLTEIFAANGHALADAGYATVDDPTLALPTDGFVEAAMQSYRMPGAAHGVAEDLRVLQYVAATSKPDTYVMYSLTIPESRFATEAATFRRWVMAFHGNQPLMGSTVSDLGFAPDIGQEKVGALPLASREPVLGTGPMAAPDQAPRLLDQSASPYTVPLSAVAQTATNPGTAVAPMCGTGYTRGQTAMDSRLSHLPLFLLDEDATVAQVRTLRHNTGSLNDYIHLWPSDSRSDVAALVKARHEAADAALMAPTPETAAENNFDAKGAAEAPNWLAHFEVGQRIWSVLPPGIQECLSTRPSDNPQDRETGWETYDDCHDGAVTTLSLAISGAQLLFSSVGVGHALEAASTALDGWDDWYKRKRLNACIAGSPTGVSKFGQPAVKLDENGRATQDWQEVCLVLLVESAYATAAMIPVIGTGVATVVKKVLEKGGSVAKQLQKKVADLAKRLELDPGTTDSPVVQKGIQKLANRIDKFSNRVDAILHRRTEQIASKEARDRVLEVLKDAGKDLIKGGAQAAADQRQDFQNKEITAREFVLNSVEGALNEVSNPEELLENALGLSSKHLKLQGADTAAYVMEIQKELLVPPVKHIFALITRPLTATATAGHTRAGLVIPTTLRPVLTEHLRLSIGNMPGIGNKPSSLTMAAAGTWQSQSSGQSRDEGDLSTTDLVWLALYMLGADSDGGPLLTAAERDLLETVPLAPDVSVEQRHRLVQNVQALAEGTAEPALTAALEEALQSLQTRVELFQGVLEVLEHQLEITGAGLSTLALADIPDRQPVARNVNYLLVDRQTGFAHRGNTDQSGLGDVLWLGTERAYSLLYHDPAADLGAVTSFRSGTGIAEHVISPVLAGPVDPLDTDGDGLTDFAEQVQGRNPDAATPAEEWTPRSSQTDSWGWTDTPGYALDICAAAPERLAVLDMLDGLSLFQPSNPPIRMHHIPTSAFGEDLMALHCHPFSDGRDGLLVVETLTGALWSVRVHPDGILSEPAALDLNTPTDDPAPFWRAVAFAPSWLFLGDNRGQLQILSINQRDPAATAVPTAIPLLNLSDPIEGLAFQLDTLYVLTSRSLQAYHVELHRGTPPVLHLLGRVWIDGQPALDEWRRVLTVAGDRAYVGSQQGLTEVDIADPLTMEVLRFPHVDQGMIQDLVPVSREALLVLTQFTADSARFLALMDADPRQDRIESVFLRPSVGHFERLALVDGRLFAAAGPQGIAALPMWDLPSSTPSPPQIRTNFTAGRWEEGIPLNMQVVPATGTSWHRAELYYRETRIAWDAAPPLELTVPFVDLEDTSTPVELVLTDNRDRTTTVPLSLSPVADARPPRLLGVTPTVRTLDLLVVADLDHTLTLHFSEPVVLDIPDEPMVRLLYRDASAPGPALFREMSLDLELTEGETNIRVGLPEDLPAGEYLLVTHPELRDTAGNFLPQVWVGQYALQADADASTLETRTNGMEDPATWTVAAPVGTDSGQTITITGSGGVSRDLLTATTIPVGQSSQLARSDQMAFRVSQAQQQDVQALADDPEEDVEELFAAINARDVEKVRQLLAAGANPNARRSDGMTPLIAAAHGGDRHVEMIRLLLAHGADVNARVADDWTALHAAAHQNLVEAVEVLLTHGAEIHIRNKWGRTPLYDAAAQGHVEAARILLAAGTDPNMPQNDGMTPLIAAARGGDRHVEMIRLLLAYGSNVNAQVPDGWTALHAAAHQNLVEAVEVLLTHGAEIHIRNRWGRTPLYDAAAQGHVEAARILLAAGTDPNMPQNDGDTPLHATARRGQTDLARLLLAAGADPNARRSDGMTPLIAAAHGGDRHVEMIRLLLAHGADVNARVADDWTALHAAAHQNLVEAVEVLLTHCAEVHIRNKWGRTPLYDAAAQGHVEAARILLAAGTDPNMPQNDGMTPLIAAARGGDRHVEMIRLLLAYGTNVNAQVPDGWTALHAAAHQNLVEAVEVLLTHGAEIHIRNKWGRTPLYDAAAQGHVEAARILLAAGTDPNMPQNDGDTPLHATARRGQTDLARLLLAAGANPNARRSDGMTPLIAAAHGGDRHVEMIRLLLAHGADVNARVADDWTALHAAAHQNLVEAVEVLLTHGAEIHIRNKWGRTPLYDAAAQGHVEAARILLAAGTDPNMPQNDGMTPLIAAARGGDRHVEMIRLLLAYGTNVNAQVPDGWTALHAAAHQNLVEAVEVLLTHGAEIHIRNRWGRTPLYDAAAQGHVEAARILLAAGTDPNMPQNDGMTPLIAAAHGGDRHVEMIRLLLAHGADVNARVPDGRTALDVAKERGQEDTVSLLLTHGANPGDPSK